MVQKQKIKKKLTYGRHIIHSHPQKCYSNFLMHDKYKALKNKNNHEQKKFTFFTLTVSINLSLFAICLVFFFFLMLHSANAVSVEDPVKDPAPRIKDFRLKVDLVNSGFKFPSSMAFLGPNDILVLEKNEGLVKRLVDGKLLPQPLLQVPVANVGERGLVGIAVAKNQTGFTRVFLYYTKSGGGVTGDDWTDK